MLKDGDSEVLKLVVSEAMFDREVLGRRVPVGDGARELEAVDEMLGETVVLCVTLRVGRSSTVKLWDMLIEGEVLMEVVGEIEDEVDAVDVGVMEADDDADEVRVVEDEGLWLTVVDTVAELLLDSDVLND